MHLRQTLKIKQANPPRRSIAISLKLQRMITMGRSWHWSHLPARTTWRITKLQFFWIIFQDRLTPVLQPALVFLIPLHLHLLICHSQTTLIKLLMITRSMIEEGAIDLVEGRATNEMARLRTYHASIAEWPACQWFHSLPDQCRPRESELAISVQKVWLLLCQKNLIGTPWDTGIHFELHIFLVGIPLFNDRNKYYIVYSLSKWISMLSLLLP